MEELMMKMKLMRQRRIHGRHIFSSGSHFSFTSLDDSEAMLSCGRLSTSDDNGEFWWPQPPNNNNHEYSARSPPSPPPFQTRGLSAMEMMKESFSRLLLGEDMTGSGHGVSIALAISNAITNLSTTTFGQLCRLEPLSAEKKEIWRRNMKWLLSVADHIVELVPSYKTFPDGTTLEVMTCQQRSDLSINLPALRKLDDMLLDLLDGFSDTEFWYLDQEKSNADSTLCGKAQGRQKMEWRLPVPRIPEDGLSIDSKTQLNRKRECAVQILKAAMLINTDTISKMEVPDSYLESLPKTGKACLGDQFYKFIASKNFSIESVLDCLDLSAEHIVKELVNRLEATIYVWHRRSQARLAATPNGAMNKYSAVEVERREFLSTRVEDLLFALRHQFPHLPHTNLDAIKVQCNKDVGKSILESYSGALKTLAYNLVARIDDLLSFETPQGKYPSPSKNMTQTHRSTISDTYFRRSISVSSKFSPATNISSKPDIDQFLNKVHRLNRQPQEV